MPTAAKLIGALFFTALGYFAADLVIPLLPEGTRTTWLNETVGFFGLIFGWGMAGKNAGTGYRASMGFGLTAAALITFWAVVAFSGAEMLQMSMDRRYSGPMQAVKSMFAIAWDMFRLIGTQEIILTAVIGGIVGGLVCESTSRRWS